MSTDSSSSCPTRDELARVLADDDHPHRVHVESCKRCQTVLSMVVTGGPLVRELRDYSGRGPTVVASDIPAIDGFDIVREVHRGGQGVVYEATVVGTGERVALKALLGGRWATTNEVRRFEREVELVAALDHPNIVTLYQAGRASDGSPFYSMELLDGTTLAQFVEKREQNGERFALNDRIELFLAVGSAVEYAHRHGVIHRDLKPSNILVDRAGVPHVLDFGLAKSLEPGPELTLTRTGDFVGSPAWAAPEQVRGDRRADTRTDVYALGLILYRLVTGHHAYPIDGPLMSVVDHVLHTTPTPLRHYMPRRNADLEAVVRRALEKSPDERYDTVGALLEDCRRLRRGETVVARRSRVARTWRTIRQHPSLSLGLALVIVTLATATVLARRRIRLLEYQGAREVAASLPGIEGAHLQSEHRLWEAILTGVPYGSSTSNASFPAALPFHWSLRNYYQRVPVLNRVRVRNTFGTAFHPTRDEFLVLSRSSVLAVLTLPDLESLERPPELERVKEVRYSPDGSSFVTGSVGALIAHAAVEVGGESRAWTVPIDTEELVDFDLIDDRHLALLQSDRFSVWDVAARAHTLGWETAGAGVARACFGRAIVTYPDRLPVLDDGSELSFGPIHELSVSSNQRHAVVRSDSGMHLWSGLDLPLVKLVSESRSPAQVSNDGRWVALANGSRIVALDLGAGDAPIEYECAGHVRPVHGLAWSSSNRYLVSWDHIGELIVWEPSVQWSRALLDHESASSESGMHAFDVRGGRIAGAGLWESAGYARVIEQDAREQTYTHPGKSLTGAVFVDDRTVALSGQGSLYVWRTDAPPPREPRFRIAGGAELTDLATSPDGRRLATVDDTGVLRVFDADELLSAREAVEPSLVIDDRRGARVSSVAWSPNARELIATRPGGGVVRFELATGASELNDAPEKTPARCVAFHPTQKFFVTGDDHGALRYWDATSCRLLIETPNAHFGRVNAVAFDATGRLLCTGDSVGKVVVWYVDDRPGALPETLPVPIFSFDTPHGEVFDLEFLGPDKLLTGGSIVELMEWDLTALDRYIAGNLEHWIGRLGSSADPELVARMRAWKAGLGAGD